MNITEVKRDLLTLRKRFVRYVDKNGLDFPEDLAGACGICSYLSFLMLHRKGLRPIFHMNKHHCYVTVQGYWVDLTLTQFVQGCDPVFFKDHPYSYSIGWMGCVHRPGRKATSLKVIPRLFRGWPECQNPFKQNLPTRRLTKAKVGL